MQQDAFSGTRTWVEQAGAVEIGTNGTGRVGVGGNWRKKTHDDESAQCPV